MLDVYDFTWCQDPDRDSQNRVFIAPGEPAIMHVEVFVMVFDSDQAKTTVVLLSTPVKRGTISAD